jgi:hypothetical protein
MSKFGREAEAHLDHNATAERSLMGTESLRRPVRTWIIQRLDERTRKLPADLA